MSRRLGVPQDIPLGDESTEQSLLITCGMLPLPDWPLKWTKGILIFSSTHMVVFAGKLNF